MKQLSTMPASGVIVIMVIVLLFLLSLCMLFYVYSRYRALARKAGSPGYSTSSFLNYIEEKFTAAYEQFGTDVNTPGIIAEAIGTKLGGLLLIERFLNNAVSLFVTLGLFGTFLGLSLSVSSLTELLSYSSTTEWLSVLNNVGSGLLSALSGMGVAFYTSLVGVACSIVLTILRAIFSPEKQRALLETRIELLMDHSIAPRLKTKAVKGESALVQQLIGALDSAAESMDRTLQEATASLQQTALATQSTLGSFQNAVNTFHNGVRDFAEVDYNLRGTVERMDVVLRDFNATLRDLRRAANGGKDE